MEQINKYHWLQYQQIEANQYLVLRLFRDEYVVHLYNVEDDGHYLGVYCGDDLNKAQQVYERKLAHYRGEKITPRPHNLLDALNHVRLTNLCNMADIVMVTEILEDYGQDAIAVYLRENRERYCEILEELGEYVRECELDYRGESKSLAQQLADEMGWEVIVD